LKHEITGLGVAFLNLLGLSYLLEARLSSMLLHIELENEDAEDESEMEDARRLSQPSSIW